MLTQTSRQASEQASNAPPIPFKHEELCGSVANSTADLQVIVVLAVVVRV
jgi:hypothetical protein